MKLSIKKVICVSAILIFTCIILCNKVQAMEFTTGESIYIVQENEINTIKVGEQLQLTVEGTESLTNRVKNTDVIWTSSDETIAKVDEKGLVTALFVGKVTIKAELTNEHQSTYEINIEKGNKTEVAIEFINDEYDISSNKKEINLNTGSSDTIEIIAGLKEGLCTIDRYEERIDSWNVEWKIENGTIASCIPEKGIKNNIHGITQTAGRARIQALKAGSTQLLVKVKVSDDKFEEIKIPIIVKNTNTKNNTDDSNLERPIEIIDDEYDYLNDTEKNKGPEYEDKVQPITQSEAEKNNKKLFIVIGIICSLIVAVGVSGFVVFNKKH